LDQGHGRICKKSRDHFRLTVNFNFAPTLVKRRPKTGNEFLQNRNGEKPRDVTQDRGQEDPVSYQSLQKVAVRGDYGDDLFGFAF
jgi:hypothetical protein